MNIAGMDDATKLLLIADMNEMLGIRPLRQKGSPMTTIWIVETLTDYPSVGQYEAFEIRETGASVQIRGGRKFIRAADRRHFFTSKVAMLTFCRSYLERSLKKAEERVKGLKDRLDAGRPWLRFEIVPPTRPDCEGEMEFD